MGQKRENHCRLQSIIAIIIGCFILSSAFKTEHYLWMLLLGTSGILLLVVGIICWDISLMNPADSHSILTLSVQYSITRIMLLLGNRLYRTIHDETFNNLSDSQEKLLKKILTQNAATEYGIEHRFSEVDSRKQFQTQHPLTDYSNYVKYIERIEKGDKNVLTADPVVFMAMTSGTTGKCKVLPVTGYMKKIGLKIIKPLLMATLDKKVGLTLQRVFSLAYKSTMHTTQCGLKKSTITNYMRRHLPHVLAPEEAFNIANEHIAMFVHAVFSLREREVGEMEALMSTLVLSFWIVVDRKWQEICDAIELGSIPLSIVGDEKTARILNSYLKPDIERARDLRTIFKGFRGSEMIGVARKVWPNLRFVRMLATGGFAHHARLLSKTYMKGITQVSILHAASEGIYGFNMNPDKDDLSYTAMTEFGVLEFIHETMVEEEQPTTLFVEQLIVGQKYEIVITSPMGLYRYRTGDIIQVVKHQNQCPVYHFLYRRGQLLNLFWEKTPENIFYEAIESTFDNFESNGITLVDFTSTENIFVDEITGEKSEQRHYVLFLEVTRLGEEYILSEDECSQFDERLCQLLELYSDLRHSGSISFMQIIQLQPGSFQLLKETIIRESQNQQYKVPRVLRNKQLLQLLWNLQIRNIQTINY